MCVCVCVCGGGGGGGAVIGLHLPVVFNEVLLSIKQRKNVFSLVIVEC